MPTNTDTTTHAVPWGLPVPATATIAWGARAIKRCGQPCELLWDRQGWYGGTQEERDAMSSDMNARVLPVVRDMTQHLMGDDTQTYVDQIADYTVIYSCRGSCGYLYLSIYQEA